tara:strand:- start:1419 stop:2495 length:1077 start_codon:yes stop_codon:yes gene_type:complete
MATITSASAVTLADGIREDLGNVIFNVSPFNTPFTSGIANTEASADNHEWLTDNYSASSGANGAIEAEAISTSDSDNSARTRLGNRIQIANKVVAVTKKAEMFDRAGVPGKEMAYQLLKLGKELQMDVERQTLAITLDGSATAVGTVATQNLGAGTGRNVKATGSSSARGNSAGIGYYLTSNQSVGASGGGTINTDNTAGNNGEADALTPGTAAALSQTTLDGLFDGVWNGSGDFSNVKLMATAATVGRIRKLTGMSTDVNTDASSGEIINRVAVYQSQFGPVAVVPNKHVPINTAYILDMSTLGLATGGGKKIHTTDIATTASAEKKLLECYYTLEVRSQAANAAYYAIHDTNAPVA